LIPGIHILSWKYSFFYHFFGWLNKSMESSPCFSIPTNLFPEDYNYFIQNIIVFLEEINLQLGRACILIIDLFISFLPYPKMWAASWDQLISLLLYHESWLPQDSLLSKSQLLALQPISIKIIETTKYPNCRYLVSKWQWYMRFNIILLSFTNPPHPPYPWL